MGAGPRYEVAWAGMEARAGASRAELELERVTRRRKGHEAAEDHAPPTTRLPAGDLGDQMDLAVPGDRLQQRVLADDPVDLDRHALLDLIAQAGKDRKSVV